MTPGRRASTETEGDGAMPQAGGSPVRCPFCESTNTRKESDFGTTLAYAQFYCIDCRTVFEWLKWEDNVDDQSLPRFLTKP
jgi:hypothetical protein